MKTKPVVNKQWKNTDNLVPWKKGQSGNPKGRPKGKTIKEMVRDWLDEHPDDMKSFVKHFVKNNKELAWQMLEGRPKGDVLVDQSKTLIVQPILGGNSVPADNSDKKNTEIKQEN